MQSYPASRRTFASDFHIVEGNGAFPRDLHFFVSLACDQHDVSRVRFTDGQSDSGFAVGFDLVFSARRCSPTIASFMIASGSSLRGLSEVKTTKSLPRPAASPISGRLARSRSPPQPNTRDYSTLLSCLLNEFSRQCGQISQRVVGMGIVHDYGERLLAIHALETARHADESADSSRDFFRLAVPRIRSARRGQNVVHIDFADQRRK